MQAKKEMKKKNNKKGKQHYKSFRGGTFGIVFNAFIWEIFVSHFFRVIFTFSFHFGIKWSEQFRSINGNFFFILFTNFLVQSFSKFEIFFFKTYLSAQRKHNKIVSAAAVSAAIIHFVNFNRKKKKPKQNKVDSNEDDFSTSSTKQNHITK